MNDDDICCLSRVKLEFFVGTITQLQLGGKWTDYDQLQHLNVEFWSCDNIIQTCYDQFYSNGNTQFDCDQLTKSPQFSF